MEPAELVLMAVNYACAEVVVKDASDSEESSEDNELLVLSIIKRKRRTKPIRVQQYVETVVRNYSPTQIQQNFRMTVDAFESLLRIIGPQLQRQGTIGRNTIDVEKQVLSVLWLLSTPDSYRSVSERFDLGKSSLSTCFQRVVKILCGLAPRIIQWPIGERLRNVREQFRAMGGLDNIVGAVDGTFILIKAPKDDPQSYITRKCNYAITLQAICDSFLKFTDVFVGYPGSVSDTRIFKNSPIYQKIVNNLQLYFPHNQFIVADKAYPVLLWCIPPYINRGNLTPAQRNFNTVLSRHRQIIERCFALLFGRFRRLKYLDMNRSDWIPSTVLSSCVLHNLCLDNKDGQIEDYIMEGLNHVNENENLENIVYEHQNPEGIHRRDALCIHLFGQMHG